MGLFDWLKPKPRQLRQLGPTPEGLYGQLPKGAILTGPDPAGDPTTFVPGSGDYVFDISEWRWDEVLWIEVTTGSTENLAGFVLVLGLSDGSHTDGQEAWKIDGRGAPILEDRQEWTIPRRHPTRELVLVSQGERTTRVLRKLEACFGFEPLAHPALPEGSTVVCELLMLRGIILPDEGRFTMRTKVVLPEHDGWAYGEFFLNINSETRQIWFSEKSDEYRIPILERMLAVPEATSG